MKRGQIPQFRTSPPSVPLVFVVARGLEGNPEGDVAGIFPVAGTRDGRREVGTQREAAFAPGRPQAQQGPVVLASRHVSIVRIAAAHSWSYRSQNPICTRTPFTINWL